MSAKTLEPTVAEELVKRFMRHKTTRDYFWNGGWTSNPDDASSFSDVVEVAETCTRYGLSDVDVAVRFESSTSDLFCTSIR